MSRTGQRGLSLIEILVAIVIAMLLLLGLVQVFAASKSSYRLAEGLARVQENGRFAIDFIQRDLRMAGHFGCINDQAHLQKANALDSHLDAAGPTQFALSLQGYEAANTAPGGSVNLSGPSGAWTPALPPFIANLNPIPGSDIIAVRYLRPEGVPITSINSAAGLTTVTFAPTGWGTLTQDGETNPGLFGIADCNYADVFQATTVDSGSGTITIRNNNLNVRDFAGQRYTESPAGQTLLYRAESVVYYVARRDNNAANEPALFRARFNSAPGGALTTFAEELVEGVENLQFVMAQDRSANMQQLTGYMGQMGTADGADLGTSEPGWRRVGLVQVGVLARSGNAAGAAQTADANRLRSLGVEMIPAADDRRLRAVYETSVALRNRLYGN